MPDDFDDGAGLPDDELMGESTPSEMTVREADVEIEAVVIPAPKTTRGSGAGGRTAAVSRKASASRARAAKRPAKRQAAKKAKPARAKKGGRRKAAKPARKAARKKAAKPARRAKKKR